MSIEQRTIDHAKDKIESYKEIINLQKEIIDNLRQQNDILERQVIALGEAACPHG